MVRTNLCTILVIFANFVIQFPTSTIAANNLFSIISDTVLERRTEYEFENPEAISIDSNSTDADRLKRMFRQYLFLATEEMDKQSQSNRQNTNISGYNLHLNPMYVDIFNKINVKFHHITSDLSQFEKLSQETQITITNSNMRSFVNRYHGTMPWFTFTGLVENDDVNHNFTFNITEPLLREEYQIAPNNEGNMKIKSKLERFTFNDFILQVTNNTEDNDKTYEMDTTTLQWNENQSVETSTPNSTNTFSTTKSVLLAPQIHEQIHTPNTKLLGTLADTWLINIVDYLNEKYVEPRIFAENELFERINKMNLLEELCNSLIPNTVDISNFEDWLDMDRSEPYRSYLFSQVEIDGLRKFVRCNSIDYSPKTTKKSQCLEIDSSAKYITFTYEYSPEAEYRSQLNWMFTKKGRALPGTEHCFLPHQGCQVEYFPDSGTEINVDYINSIIIELSMKTNKNKQPIDDSVQVSVKVNMSSTNLNNVRPNIYRERLLPHVYKELLETIKSRVEF